MGLLNDLDERYLPGLARRLDALVHRLPSPPEPTGPAPVIVRLRRVDDRWTGSGPLALVRDVPQVGAVVIAALVLAGGVTVRSRSHPRSEASPGPGQTQGPVDGTAGPDGDVGGHVGPDLAMAVPGYLQQTRTRFERAVAAQPDGVVLAVVSFSSYRTPAQVRDLLGPIQVKRIFYRARLPLDAAKQEEAPVEDLVKDSRRVFIRVAADRASQIARLREFIPTVENDDVTKAANTKDLHNFEREYQIFRGPCACVFAVVVRAKLRLLGDVARNRDIRVIDPSPVGGKLQDFVFTALLPEETKTVTGGNQAG